MRSECFDYLSHKANANNVVPIVPFLPLSWYCFSPTTLQPVATLPLGLVILGSALHGTRLHLQGASRIA